MKLLNYGSLNYDYVYAVQHIVQPQETISSANMEVFCGGKGLNQSIAMARAGIEVFHAGLTGEDGEELIELCYNNNIDTRYIIKKEGKSGHTIIQVSQDGQNSIILFAGSNGLNTVEYIDEVLSGFSEGDMLLLQNEVNLLDVMIERAYQKKMTIVLNPSPYNEQVEKCDLNKVAVFLMNEIEGAQITGEKAPDKILAVMQEAYPNAEVVLTLGKDGVFYNGKGKRYFHESCKVKVVDTTAAGDTFTGYYIAALVEGKSVKEALHRATLAASIAVTQKGAAVSIPNAEALAAIG